MYRIFRDLPLQCFIFLLLFELCSIVVVHSSLWKWDIPSYTIGNVRSSYWKELSPVFGAWHTPHSGLVHRKSCFNVEYSANSYGARDIERPRQYAGERVIVLGDSFMEGYGLSDEERLSNILEEKTKIPHMNFGATGYVGTLQYQLIYQTLASEFDHTQVLVGVFPNNDFLDNDYSKAKALYSDRYRPYYVKDGQDYKIKYHLPQLEDAVTNNKIYNSLPARIAREFLASYHVVLYLRKNLLALLYNPSNISGGISLSSALGMRG
jgi:hypothetical protein